MKKKTFYSFLIAFILLVAVIFINKRSFNSMREYNGWVNHSRDVITSLEKLSNHFKSAQIYSPTYDSAISGSQFYSLYKAEAESIPGELKSLTDLVKDNAEQTQRTRILAGAIGIHLPTLMQYNIVEIIKKGEGWRLAKFFQIHALINNMIVEENKLLQKREQELSASTRLTGTLTNIFSISAIVLILTTFLSNVLLTRKSIWLEGFLESVLDTSQNGIITYKAIRENGKITDFKIVFANQSVERLLGLNPQGVINKRLSQMPSYVREAELFDRYITVADTGQQMEFETLYKQGNIEKWFFVSLGKLEDGVTATFHDISNLKKYEKKLKANIIELKESNAELEQYAFAASHDLQEPLRKIRTFGSFLKDTQADNLDEKGKNHLEKILSSAERMSILIKDILGFSGAKKESGFTPTDLNKIVANALEDLELLINQKGAVVKLGSLPVIDAIPLQMSQLFYNLLNNAVKFTREDATPLIEIDCKSLSAEEAEKYLPAKRGIRCYEIIIKDNGMGFDPHYSNQIFEMFKRLGDKKNFPGSGIGLALCRKVIGNHNGFIYAEGKENEGASFHLILPEKQV